MLHYRSQSLIGIYRILRCLSMRLSAKLITNFCNINMFNFTDQWKIRAGDPNTLYFQIVDLDQGCCGQTASSECALRYLVGLGSSNQPYGITVTFPSIDDSKIIKATAIQSNAADSSIWQVNILSSQLPFSGNVFFSVMEGINTRTFNVTNALAVEYPLASGCC